MNVLHSRACRLALLLLMTLALASIPLTAFAGGGSGSGDSGQLAAGTIQAGEQGEADAAAQADAQIEYRASTGAKWGAWKKQGGSVGKAGKKLQLVRMKVAKDGLRGAVKYRLYGKGKGWLSWTSGGKIAGAKGSVALGLQVKLSGQLAKQFDVVYRVCLDGKNWQPWVVNGTTAGSAGKLGAIQKYQVKLVRRNFEIPLADGAYFLTSAADVNATLQVPKSSTAPNVQIKKSVFKNSGTNLRFFIRNQADGTVLLQSCASGLYLCERSGKVVQRPDTGVAAFRWNVSAWDGGYILSNAKTGNQIALSGAKAVTAAQGARWSFTRTDVVADGTYAVTSKAMDMALAVKGESTSNGAKLLVQGHQEANAEVFRFARAGRDTYRITNEGSGKRIEVKNGSTAQKAVVRQNGASSGTLQKWKLVLEIDGSYRLVNKASKKSLTALGDGDAGSSVRSCADVGASTQRWVIAAQKSYVAGPVARAAKLAATQNSSTSYFIAVDLSNHWVCIFKGSKGSRKLIKSWQCSTGKPGMETPTGEYTTGYKQYSFGSGYTVYYATAFIGYVYLFHSIKYNEGTFNVQDGRLGQSVSEGCIRLALANAKWIYDNIPSGTKVKIYY